jgi:hypothetical protein
MRKWLVAFLGASLTLIGLLLALVMPRPCPVNRATVEQIKEGMTQAEVHKVLGPPGDYRTRPPTPSSSYWRSYTGAPRLIEEWSGDEGMVDVEYTPSSPGDEKVMITHFENAEPHSPGVGELIAWRLKKLWARWFP